MQSLFYVSQLKSMSSHLSRSFLFLNVIRTASIWPALCIRILSELKRYEGSRLLRLFSPHSPLFSLLDGLVGFLLLSLSRFSTSLPTPDSDPYGRASAALLCVPHEAAGRTGHMYNISVLKCTAINGAALRSFCWHRRRRGSNDLDDLNPPPPRQA